jgi:valyl-tRNA synthetase
LEKEIESIEKEIAELDKKFADPDFTSKASTEDFDAYDKKKARIDKLMEEWEKINTKLS